TTISAEGEPEGRPSPEIAATFGGAAVRVTSGNVLKLSLARGYVFTKSFKLRNSCFSGGVKGDPTFWILPRSLPPRAFVLDQDIVEDFFLFRSDSILTVIGEGERGQSRSGCSTQLHRSDPVARGKDLNSLAE
ncbi:hypothetical protein U1Q18_032529, partial [Sarracenia purpurea var. burkii]